MNNPLMQLAIANFGQIEAPLPQVVGGQTQGIAAQFLDLKTGLPLVLDLGIKLAAFLLLLLLAFGGFRYMISIGNEEGSEQAKRFMTAAVIGFVLLLGTWAIMNRVFGLLGYAF